MRKLLSATAVVSISTLVNVLVGYLKGKYVAITLGPEGMGLFSQASYFVQTSSTFVSFGMGIGITRYVGKYWAEGSVEKVKQILYSAILLQISVSLLFVISILIFSKEISNFIFSTDLYNNELILLSMGIPFLVIVTTFENSFFGFGKYGVYTRSRVTFSLLGLIPLFVLIWLWGLKGGLIYFFVNSLLIFIVSFYFFLLMLPEEIRWELDLSLLKLKKNMGEARNLLKHSGIFMISSTIGMLCMLFVRSLVIKSLGPEANGIYQVVFAISGYYFPFFNNGVGTHYYLRMSSLKSAGDFCQEINNTIRPMVLIITPVIVFLLIFKKVIIVFISSIEFLPAQELFAIQLSGDFFLLLSSILSMSLLGRARLKVYFAMVIVSNIFFVFFYLILREYMGLKSIAIAFVLSNSISFFLNLYYHVKDISLSIEIRNILLISASLILIAAISFLDDVAYMVLLKVFLTAIWFFTVTSKEERFKVKNYLYSFKKRELQI